MAKGLIANGASSQTVLKHALDYVDKMDIRYFAAVPIHREKLMYGLWEGVDAKQAKHFLDIIRLETPPKEEHKLAKKFVADPKIEPELALITSVCISCHGGNPKGGNIPQFAHAENLEELKDNVFYFKEKILVQLKGNNMPPVYDFSPFSAQDRESLIQYLEKMKLREE